MANLSKRGWKECKLGDLGLVVTGKTPSVKCPEDFGNEIPFVTPTDYKDYHKEVSLANRSLSAVGAERFKNKILPPKSVMVTCIGSDMGKVAINKVTVLTNQQINSIIPDKRIIDPDFLYYKLVESYDILRSYGLAGTTMPIVNKTDFENIIIGIPVISEQRAIGGVLFSLDDKIDLLHRQNKTLESLAETLWRKMFVEDTDSNWKVGKLGEEMDIIMGQSPEGSTYNEDKQGMVFFQGRAEFDFRFPQTRLYCTDPKRLAKKGDTLVSVRAPVGDINIAYEDCCIGRGLAAVRHKRGYLSYTFYKIRSLKDELDSFEQQGTVFGSIGKDDFNNIETPIPLETIVKSFESVAKPFDYKIFINSTQIRTLSHLRDLLLPKLMNGEVRLLCLNGY
jgi:type I restriction enzyme S subunit